ncbi:MAG: BACON domain-containing protein [Dysgonamonadaceae bacterium]|jgi:hypothetical protein|nr:BACON domain-containing protein [Dysgonamonadaceae bacterium]
MKHSIKKLSVFIAVACICFFTACEEKEEAPTLELDKETVTIEGDSAAVTTFTVNSNTAWKIYPDRSWIKVSPESGTGPAVVTITIDENNDGDARTGEVEVIAGSRSEKITVYQSKTINVILSKETLTLGDTMSEDSKTFTVKSDVAWTMEIEGDWFKATPVKGAAGKTVIVTVSAGMNNAGGDREGKIVIKTDTRRVACTVTQTMDDLFFGSSEIVNLSDKGGYRFFRFTSSYSWTVTGSESWIQIDQTSGSAGSHLLKISAGSENSAASDRQGKLIFTGGGKTKEFTVVQGHTGNYWNDGDVKVFNKHTKGKGVPVVIAGDGFDREDLKKGGWWENWATHLAENFKRNEVICDLLDYIDVLILMSESTEHGINYPPYTRTKTKFGAYGAGENQGAVEVAARNAVKKVYTQWRNEGYDVHTDAEVMSTSGNWGADGSGLVRIMFMANGPYPGNASNPMCRMGVDEPDYDYWAIHEFTGHTLCDIPDMYWSGCGYNSPQNVADLMVTIRAKHHPRGYSWFIDDTDDPTQAIWKDFYGRDGYTEATKQSVLDVVGAYRTTWSGNFCEGLWGPSQFSCMREHRLDFDLGSRFQIFNTIHWRAGDYEGKYNNIEAFIAFDKIRTRGFSYKGAYTDPAAKPRTWTKYNQKTGQKIADGDYDRFWQVLYPRP